MASKTLEEKASVGEDQSGQGLQSGQELEEYDCGCKVRFRQLDYGEAGDELPRRGVVMPELLPCSKHSGAQTVPSDARLVKVRREHESFLNE
jgi:hypothetical protein